MSHEIYYTSAPEGLKRGTSGFCTVGASDNIPKPLWDRLETLSAYRHQFSTGGDGSAGAAGQNPVSSAHWILNIANKTYHVLSRICDSGVDHTHRTNAFAHHVALDPAEIAAAPGGPAWLLGQPGVMVNHWNQQVGAITRGGLPTGDNFASRVCRAWAAVTGDAGWGGHLAEVFLKAPTRPVCILFSSGQDLLPLVAESLALLPPQARWNVTFNTYFTSMPTSATCLWRCCLAGTPAAQIGLRYAANGLVLDLTDRNRLPALPAGALVTMARTGESGPTAVRPSASIPPPRGTAPAAKFDRKAAPRAPLEIDDDEEQLEKQRDSVFEFSPVDEAQLHSAVTGGSYDLAPGEERGEAMPTPEILPSQRGGKKWDKGVPQRSMRRAEDALLETEREADRAAQRRRKQVMLLFIGALGAMAIGTLVIFMMNKGGPAEGPAPATSKPSAVRVTPPPVTVVEPQTVVVPDTVPAHTQPVVVVATEPATMVAVVAPPAIVYPEVITLGAALDQPNPGTGIGERVQSFAFPAADVDHAASVTGLRLHVPARPNRPDASTLPENSITSEALGTITGTPVMRSGKPGISLMWKASGASAAGAGTELGAILYDQKRPGLDVQLHARELLKNPELFSYLLWVLQGSQVELNTGKTKAQRVAFKAFELPAVSLGEAAIVIPWPVDLPGETVIVPPKQAVLPAGWQGNWYTDWDSKDVALRTAANASQVLKFKKGTGNVVEPWFTLTFRPGFAKVESTLAQKAAEETAALAKSQSDYDTVSAKIDSEKARLGTMFIGDGAQELLAKQEEAKKLVEAYKSSIAAYHEITTLDIAFELPDGVRLATVRFQQNLNAAPATAVPETGK